METIYLDNFTKDGIIIEKDFRTKVKETNWESYKNKKVLIKGCSSIPVPTWAYLIVATHLSQYAKIVYYGESCSLIPIFNK
mgnify:CR=1 FL=1